MLGQQNHAAGEGNGSIMVGMFVCLCLARPKDVYIPTRMDLDVKLLRLRAHQLFKLANIISGHKLKSYYPCMKFIKKSGTMKL